MRSAFLVAAPLALLVLLFAPVGCVDGSAHSQNPVREEKVYVEFFPPPTTLNEMILKADRVVLGRIVGSSPRDADLPGKPKAWVRTGFHIQVLETFYAANDQPSGLSNLTVIRQGGLRDRGSHIEKTIEAGFQPFEVGKEYFLFLRFQGGEWQPAYGPDSVYELSSQGRVVAFGSSAIAESLAKMSAEEFKVLLRNYGVGGK